MRYAWDQFDAYFGPQRVGPFASRWVYGPLLKRLARWDAATAPRVGRFVANSQHVAGRIRRYYNREATIVYPPVDTTFYHPDTTPPGQHFLIVSALVPYKRIDVAIDAARRVGAALRIVGDGPDRTRLERHANGTSTRSGSSAVEFVGRAMGFKENSRRFENFAVDEIAAGIADEGVVAEFGRVGIAAINRDTGCAREITRGAPAAFDWARDFASNTPAGANGAPRFFRTDAENFGVGTFAGDIDDAGCHRHA
jgi:glycosyltransferase involved in cell wall biosynthesis